MLGCSLFLLVVLYHYLEVRRRCPPKCIKMSEQETTDPCTAEEVPVAPPTAKPGIHKKPHQTKKKKN